MLPCSFLWSPAENGALVSFRDISPDAFEVTVLFLGETVGCRNFIRPLGVSSPPLVCLSLCYWQLGVVNESNPPSWCSPGCGFFRGHLTTGPLKDRILGDRICSPLGKVPPQKMAFFFLLICVTLFLFFKYLFIYLSVPGLQCSLWHVGSISLIRDQIWGLCIGSTES